MICGDIPTYGWVYGWMGGWISGWVLSNHQNEINLDLIDII